MHNGTMVTIKGREGEEPVSLKIENSSKGEAKGDEGKVKSERRR